MANDWELTDVNILAHADLLTELSRREKEAGIRPEPEVDLFMKVTKMVKSLSCTK
jgi:hypothetical protein